MAGMLPGVEAARRRRFHNSNPTELPPISSSGGSTRRSSFCLYASNHEFHFKSSMGNPIIGQQGMCDESRLGAAAREAKKRLDERLQPRWKTSETKRTPNASRSSEGRSTIQSNHTQVLMPKLMKIGSKKLNWLKLSWKSSEQEECTVCLEQFKGETLMQLPCGHKFHTNCLVPWLQANAHCPCCRMKIPSSNKNVFQ